MNKVSLRYLKLSVYVLCLVLLCLFSDQGFFRLRRLKATEARLKGENLQWVKKSGELQEEIRLLKDSSYLERFVRDKMGYVRSDEVLVEIAAP